MSAVDPLLERFRAYCDQYIGVTRALGEAAQRAAASGDPAQQARSFLDALTALQQQVTALWTGQGLGAGAGAVPGGGPFAAAAAAAGNPFAAFNPLAPGGPFAAPLFAAAPFAATPLAGLFGAGAGAAHPWAAFFPGLAGNAFAPAAAPALGPTREFQELCQRMAQLGEQVQQAQLRLLEQWNGIVSKALAQLGERATALLAAAPTPETLRALYDQWVDSAEAAYAQAARGPAFAAAQADFGNAQSRLRVAQREYLELAAREFDLPTRSELNTVLQQLRELRQAVRAIEERLAGPGPQGP
ncbi:MAG: poly(R)-hydroxyalkanoic acid synthase subunit PhaE [Steroidobacteraceae bacterium]